MTTETVVFLFWQPYYDDLRTLLSTNYAEILENLNALEEFLSSIQSIGIPVHQIL